MDTLHNAGCTHHYCPDHEEEDIRGHGSKYTHITSECNVGFLLELIYKKDTGRIRDEL